MNQTYVKLNNGTTIPQFGLGVFQIAGDEATRAACLEALAIGYRHIDTAHSYQNERGVGAVVRESGIPRAEIWITSKLWPTEYGVEKSATAIDKMLARLDTDYIDLLLLHQPIGDYLGAWKAMEEAVANGKLRGIGLSNFETGRLEEVLDAATIKPAALQVECHPYYQQRDLKQRIAPFGTALEVWFPLGHADEGLLQEPVFTELAAKYAKSNVQVILRWHIQAGHIVFPRTTNSQHMRENIDIFDFALNEAEMEQIRALDRGARFYTATLEEQEQRFLNWAPAD